MFLEIGYKIGIENDRDYQKHVLNKSGNKLDQFNNSIRAK